jgi:hypothetical protein
MWTNETTQCKVGDQYPRELTHGKANMPRGGVGEAPEHDRRLRVVHTCTH